MAEVGSFEAEGQSRSSEALVVSHFTVLVIGPNIEDQLQPFHEFECTGENDQYIQDVDITEEKLAEYRKETTTYFRYPDGAIEPYFIGENYNPLVLREPTAEETEKIGSIGSGVSGGLYYTSRDWEDGKGYRTKIVELPAGCVEFKAPYTGTYVEFLTGEGIKLATPETIDIANEHKYGYALVEDGKVTKVIDRTNPNAQWDWWVIGGRWDKFFAFKGIGPGVTGSRGAQGPKSMIDFEKMRNSRAKEEGEMWDKVHGILSDHPPVRPWEAVRDALGMDKIEEARLVYREQPGIMALNKASMEDRTLPWSVDGFLVSREECTEAAALSAVTPFAVLKDGTWYERGDMGWWACVSNEKDPKEWGKQVQDLIEGLPDDTMMTIVDCHI